MKFSKTAALSALTASTAIAAPAVVTVTEHVHQVATVVVQAVAYSTNGAVQTSYITVDGAVNYGKTVSAIGDAVVTPISTGVAAATNAAESASRASKVAMLSSMISEFEKEKAEAAAAKKTTTLSKQTTSAAAPAATTTTSASPVAKTTSTSQKATTQAATTTSTPTTTTSSAKAQATTTTADDSNLSDFASTILAEHNKKRALHKDTTSLTWSNELANYAQTYADNYDCSGNLAHSGGPYGENLALGYDAAGAVDAWYGEISDYNWSNPGFSSSTGHFTQVVWKSTTQVGCGIKSCNNAWGHYVICSYQSAGNVGGEYGDNVMSLL